MIERKEARFTMILAAAITTVITTAITGGCSAWGTPETGQPPYIKQIPELPVLS